MSNKKPHHIGLTIPEHIKKTLPETLIFLLEEDGHGISFNTRNSIQMRYIKANKDLGKSYPLSLYGSWESALRKAYYDNEALRQEHPNSAMVPDPKKGVRLRGRYRDDRETTEYFYQISYKKDGKAWIQSLYCGNDNTMSTERRKHAEKTAHWLRAKYCETLNPDILSLDNIRGWQHRNLWEQDT